MHLAQWSLERKKRKEKEKYLSDHIIIIRARHNWLLAFKPSPFFFKPLFFHLFDKLVLVVWWAFHFTRTSRGDSDLDILSKDIQTILRLQILLYSWLVPPLRASYTSSAAPRCSCNCVRSPSGNRIAGAAAP